MGIPVEAMKTKSARDQRELMSAMPDDGTGRPYPNPAPQPPKPPEGDGKGW